MVDKKLFDQIHKPDDLLDYLFLPDSKLDAVLLVFPVILLQKLEILLEGSRVL